MLEAFRRICTRSVPRSIWYVSLYQNTPFYGGPEEGGWWGADCSLVESQAFYTEQDAINAAKGIDALAERMTRGAQDEFNKRCLSECENAWERNIDVETLPEVDGNDEYFVVVEKCRGSRECRGTRHYE